MSRPTIRTDYLLRDDAARIKELFGTVSNGYALLDLHERVPETEFRRALSFQTIRPEHKEEIEDAWARWKGQFLRDDHARITSFVIDAPLV